MIKDLAIIVPSCDEYKRLWSPFFALFKKYWLDCPFKTYLISENPNYPGIEGISETDSSWATRLKNALQNKIREPYVFLMLEDYLLTEKVDTEEVLELFRIMKKESICHLGLIPLTRPNPQFKHYKDLKLIEKDRHRMNLQAGIWNKEILIKILKDGEDPWETEKKGTGRSYKFKPFTMMRDRFVIKYIQGAIQGEMPKETKRFLKEEGFDFPGETFFGTTKQ